MRSQPLTGALGLAMLAAAVAIAYFLLTTH